MRCPFCGRDDVDGIQARLVELEQLGAAVRAEADVVTAVVFGSFGDSEDYEAMGYPETEVGASVDLFCGTLFVEVMQRLNGVNQKGLDDKATD